MWMIFKNQEAWSDDNKSPYHYIYIISPKGLQAAYILTQLHINRLPSGLYQQWTYWLTLNDRSGNVKHYYGIFRLISPWSKWPPFRRRYFLCIFTNENFVFWLKFHRSLFTRFKLTISQLLFIWWRGALSEPILTPFTGAYMRYYTVNKFDA